MEDLLYGSLEPYCMFGFTSITDVRACILPLAVSNGLWYCQVQMGDPFSHTHISVCSHSQTAFLTCCKVVQKEETGSKSIVLEPFNKPLLKHKVITSLKDSVGADTGVWKYENTLEPLDHLRLWWTKTHNIITLWVQELPSALYLSNLFCQTHLSCQSPL